MLRRAMRREDGGSYRHLHRTWLIFCLVSRASAAADVARTHFRGRAFGAAGDVDVARTGNAYLGGLRGVDRYAARSRDRHLRVLSDEALGVDVARTGDLVSRGLRRPAGCPGITRPGNAELEAAHLDLIDGQLARAGDAAFKAVARHLVDAKAAGPGQLGRVQAWHGDSQCDLAVPPAPVETALLFGMDA